MFCPTRKSVAPSRRKPSGARGRARFVASAEAVEGRLLMTGTSAVSWYDGAQIHSEVFAIGFDNAVSMSRDGGAFVSQAGYAKSISAGLDPSGLPEVFAINQFNHLTVNDNGSGWVDRGYSVTAIAATKGGVCYAVGSDGAVYASTPWSWQALGNSNITSISAGTGTNGLSEVYALDRNNVVWSNPGWGWTNRGGYLKAIAGSTNNAVFGIGFDNALYINRGGPLWTYLGGTVKSITGGSDIVGNPEVYGIGSDNAPYSNDNGGGYRYIGGYVTELAGDAYGKVYCRCMDVDIIESSQFNMTWNMVGTVPLANPVAATAYSPAPTTAALFNPSNYGQPNYLDMQQGGAADCWLDASLAEVADRIPQAIRNMFVYDGLTVDNGATVGLYSVRLFKDDGTAFYIQVDTALPSGGSYYNRVTTALGSSTLWTALAEKAYVEANALGLVSTNAPNQGSYFALNAGDLRWALHAITGYASSTYAINPTDMASAWNSGKLVVMCTTGSTPASPGIVESHCYALVGYYAASSNPYEVFNPWGTLANGFAPGNPTKYGLIGVNAAFMSQNFTYQTYGGSSIEPGAVDLPSDGSTGVVLLDEVGPGKTVKHPGLSNPWIGSLRPIVGTPVVGGPRS